jgi:hypothetical protein
MRGMVRRLLGARVGSDAAPTRRGRGRLGWRWAWLAPWIRSLPGGNLDWIVLCEWAQVTFQPITPCTG